MKMLTLSALFACVLLPQTVSPTWNVEGKQPYEHFANWLTAPLNSPSGSLNDTCNGKNAGFDPTATCNAAETTATDQEQSWGKMCETLGKKHPCPETDGAAVATYKTTIGEINECCLNICNNPTKAGYEEGQNEKCCADCCDPDKIPTTKAAPPPTSQTTTATANSNSGDGETTTMQPTPSPGPTPSSSDSGDDETTTEEPTTTEGGSDSDSAINIGASGLLVTLITMMAAGVNIA